MKLTINEQKSVSAKGTHIYTTENIPASKPFAHLVMSREQFDPGDKVMINTNRGAMSVSVDDDGTPLMVWWV